MLPFNQLQGRFQLKIYNWYLIFNLNEFLSTNLGSKEYNLNLFSIGESTFTVYIGNVVSVMYLDQFMPINMYDEPKYEKLNYATYHDEVTGNVYFGFLVEDEN